jgi:hypothetical protein
MGHGDLECSTPVQRNTLGKLLSYNVMVRALEEKKKKKIQSMVQGTASFNNKGE